ncbi:MAG: 50S ribosomal protein L11 methyltransferase [Gammaproteobacteria bacterium]|nr:50S ribosomal protein L11 methyltransferase [Gammaproteobacteria bacterium]
MNLDSLQPIDVETVLTRHGAVAVTLSDAGDNPVLEPAPGETPLWIDTRITGLFPYEANLELLQEDLLQSFNLVQLPKHHIEALEDRLWEREWLKNFRPMKFGRRLWVSPHDFAGSFANDVVIRLDPGLAFGTGTHPTTALCLQWLDSLDLRQQEVMDFGCGSGILAIGSLLLGAKMATAIDIDPQAITASRRNAVANHVSDRLFTTLDTMDCQQTFDILVANILAGPLIELAPRLSANVCNNGVIALSGILEEQVDAVRNAYSPWIHFQAPVAKDGWVILTGTRR